MGIEATLRIFSELNLWTKHPPPEQDCNIFFSLGTDPIFIEQVNKVRALSVLKFSQSSRYLQQIGVTLARLHLEESVWCDWLRKLTYFHAYPSEGWSPGRKVSSVKWCGALCKGDPHPGGLSFHRSGAEIVELFIYIYYYYLYILIVVYYIFFVLFFEYFRFISVFF